MFFSLKMIVVVTLLLIATVTNEAHANKVSAISDNTNAKVQGRQMNIRGTVDKKQRRSEEEKEEEEEESEDEGNDEESEDEGNEEENEDDGNSKDIKDSIQSRLIGALPLGHPCIPGNPSRWNSCSHCLPVFPATYWPTLNAYACGTCLEKGAACWFVNCADECCSEEFAWKWNGVFGWNYCK